MSDISQYIEPDEKVVAEIRRHWVNVAPVVTGMFLVSLAVIYGLYALGRYGADLNPPILARLAFIGLIVIAGVIVLILYASFWVYYESRVIITTRKLIQVTQNGLFGKTISQFSLDHMQDCSSRQQGLLPTALGYGDVVVETAGEVENFVFTQAPNPKEVAGTIMRMHEQFSPEHQRKPV